MAKGGYAVCDPGCVVSFYDPDDQNLPIKLRVLKDGGFVEVPLTTAQLREIGYHAALYFRDRAGRNSFMPQGFEHPEPHPNDTRHTPAEAVTPPAPRVRVRTRPPQ